MITITILGTGNVAIHLFEVFYQHEETHIDMVYGRSCDSLVYFKDRASTTTDINSLTDSDIFIIAVSDDAIAEISHKVKTKTGLIVHTSGSKSIEVLPRDQRGVFYPVQTFTQGKPIDFKQVPICIEYETKHAEMLLTKLAGLVSEYVVPMGSEQRKNLHLAAVFANNFTNHLYYLAEEFCKQKGIAMELLKPLILETAIKANTLGPFEAQTGPAKRNDSATLEAQLELLTGHKHKHIYSLLSNAIQETYGEKL